MENKQLKHEETLLEQIALLTEMVKLKDSIIADRDATIERLEKRLRLAEGTIYKIYGEHVEFNKNLGKL